MPSYTINSITSVFQMITLMKEEVFATIQHEQEGEMGDADFQDRACDLLREEADSYASNCGCMCVKKFVEEYGVFQALKLYNDQGYGSLNYDDEDRFYRLLLCVILSSSDESYDSVTSFTDYHTYCEANPLEA
jgi:hypothetical protein